MRILILAAAIGAVALPAGAANAQYWGGGYNNRVRQEQRECRRELRHADSRREYQRELRECRREIAQARRQQYRRYSDNYYGDRYDRYDNYYGDRYDRYRGRYR